ncbi:MAG TPA: zf-HC2 domain-containing protein [Kribbellaceae bacterium]|jgi:anti-sigma factor RsiW
MTTHPLDKLAAAVDGELDHDARDKVLSHLVGCAACRAEVEDQRWLKAELGRVDVPVPSTDLMQRLLAVPEFSTEPREEVRPVPAVTLRPARSVFPAAQRPAARPATGSRPAAAARPAGHGGTRTRGVMMTAAGSAAAVVTLLGTAFAVGEPRQQPPLLQPPVNSFSVDHATSTGGYPFGDPAMVGNAAYSGAAYSGTPVAGSFQPVAFPGR